jgi:RNA recognition motif-containing protein
VGQSAGFGFVTFTEGKSVTKALNLDGHKVMNRPLKITIAKDVPEDRPK